MTEVSSRTTGPALHSPEWWLLRLFPLRRVLPVLVVAAVFAFVSRILTPQWYLAATAAAVVIVVGLTPVRGVSLAQAIGQALSLRWQLFSNSSAAVNFSPFDVPLPDGGSYGMRWDGGRLLTMLRIDVQPRTVTRLSPAGLLADDMLPLAAIAGCLKQFDIDLAAIDVISTGSRSAGTGVISRAYESILGPLPAVAHRTVWVALRLDPLANASAVDRRGGGAAGALRSALVATRRVANRLAAQALTTSVLAGAEMTSAVTHLTQGADPATLRESARSVLHIGDQHTVHHATYRMTPEALGSAGIAAIWSTPTLATTITVRMQPGRGSGSTRQVAVTALARFSTRDAAAEPQCPGLIALPGKQLRALLYTLPVGTGVPALPLSSHLGAPDELSRIPMPIAGCGQLIGADRSGQGVALPLVGRHVRRVEIIGSALVAKQVILRAIALGASVVVHTNRHDVWRPMLTYIDVPQALTLASWSAGSQQAGSYRFATVVVYDGIPPSAMHSDATVILLHPHGSPADGFEPDVVLTEDPHTPTLVTVETGTESEAVYMVATPEELAYVGAA